MKSSEVLIVGRGPAGLLGASYLRQQGCEVTVISDGQGSMSLWPGDFSFGRAVDSYKDFPMKLSGPEWRHAFDDLVSLFDSFGVRLVVPEKDESMPHTVTASGNLRPTFATPCWQYASVGCQDLIIVGMEGVADSIPAAQSASYRAQSGAQVYEGRVERPSEWDQSWSPIRFATYLETKEGFAWLARQLQSTLRNAPSGVPLLLPQVLGLANSERIIEELSLELGWKVAEFPLLSASVGGMRVRERWEVYLRDRGVHFISGRVTKVTPNSRAALADGRTFESDYLLLATGGVLGGGMRVRVDGGLVDEVTNQEVGWVHELSDLDHLGYPDANPVGGSRVLAVGRQLGGWNPNRDHNGGAMLLATVREAVQAIEGWRK